MKNCYFFLVVSALGAWLPALAVQAQVALAGPSTLYIGPGGLVSTSSNVTVGAGATLTNEGQFDLGGDLTNNGTVTAPTAPAAALRLVGSTLQAVAGTAPVPVQTLTLNNPAGATLTTEVRVAGAAVLTNGLLTVGAATPLVFLPTATNPTETATARIVGPARMDPRVVGPAAFGYFLGLEMPAGADVGTLTVTRVTGPTGVVTANGNTSTAVYWDVLSSAGGARPLHFSWLAVLDNGRNPAQATLWRSAAPFTSWTRAAAPVTNAATSPRVFAPAAAPAEAVTGRFTFADPSTPLPVELTYFTARRQGANARLDWGTASEKNSAYFDVERSRDGFGFERAGRVAAQGNSSTPHAYALTDPDVAQYGVPTLYYRLRQVDADGAVSFSPVRPVRVEVATALLVRAWPNPSAGAGPHIRVEQPTEGPLTATLTDATGRLLGKFHTTARVSEGLFAAETGALPSGVYLLRVTTAGTSRVLKLLRD